MTPHRQSQKLLPAENLYGVDVVFPDTLTIDEARMCVAVPFADGNRRDGVGDLLEVTGIRTERHRQNPISLFDHGKHYQLPVALCEDPETGAYTVTIDPVAKTATATMFFYQGKGGQLTREHKDAHCLFCEQLFHLVAQKFIRAGSIGYRIIKAYDLAPNYDTGQLKGQHLLETELLEASVVVLPANQDTVRKALALPSVCGKPLSPYLIKSLQPYVAEKATVSVPLRDVRALPKVPPAKWKPGAGATKMQGMRPDERTYRSLETADSPLRGESMKKNQPSDNISPEKARQILHDGTVQGHKLTPKQRRMFGAAAGRGEKALAERFHKLKSLRLKYGGKPSAETPSVQMKALPDEGRQDTMGGDDEGLGYTPADMAKPTYTEEQEQEQGGVPKYSLQVLERLREDAERLLEEYDGMMGPLEHDGVMGHLVQKCQSLVQEIEQVEALKAEHHPEAASGDQLREKYGNGVGEPGMDEEREDEEEMDGEMDEEADAAEAQADEMEMEESDDLPAESDEEEEEEEEPTPEEAVQGMRNDPRQKNKNKALPKRKTKGMCPKHKIVHKSGKMCKDGMGIEDGHTPGNEEHQHKPGHPLAAHQHHLAEAHGFLKEVGSDTLWSDEHRMKAFHYHKLLDDAGRLLEAEAGAATNTMTPTKKLASVEEADAVHVQHPNVKELASVEAADAANVQHPHVKTLQATSQFLHELSSSHGPEPAHRAQALLHHEAMGGLLAEIDASSVQHPAGPLGDDTGTEPMQQLKATFADEHKALAGIREKLAGLTKQLVAS